MVEVDPEQLDAGHDLARQRVERAGERDDEPAVGEALDRARQARRQRQREDEHERVGDGAVDVRPGLVRGDRPQQRHAAPDGEAGEQADGDPHLGGRAQRQRARQQQADGGADADEGEADLQARLLGQPDRPVREDGVGADGHHGGRSATPERGVRTGRGRVHRRGDPRAGWRGRDGHGKRPSMLVVRRAVSWRRKRGVLASVSGRDSPPRALPARGRRDARVRRAGVGGHADDDPAGLRQRSAHRRLPLQPKELRQLKDLIPNDADAYAADFAAAVDDALAHRAQGVCNKKKAQSPGARRPARRAPVVAAAARRPSRPRRRAARARPATGTAAPSTPNVVKAPPTPTVQPTAAPAVVAIRDAIAIAARTNDPATDAPFPILALAILAGLFALGGPRRGDRALARLGARLGRPLPPRRRRGRLARVVDVGGVHRLREVRPLAIE